MDNTNPPVVTTRPSVVPILERIKLTELFSVTDADVDSELTKYRFRDNSAGGGSFILNGAVQEANQFIEITKFQLGSVDYRGADSFSQETYSIQAFDGRFWSNISTNVITSGNVTPVVTGMDGRVSAGQLVPIENFINVSDGDNDPILQYLFVDRRNNLGGGRFVLDGTPLAQASWFSIPQGDLAGLMYRGADQGRDVEDIGVMVWDGYSWSEMAEFEIATTTEPVVVETSESVLINERRPAQSFFEVSDQDGDSIYSYNFNDYRINADGGYWEFQGQRMESAKFFTILATELDDLYYVGGSTGPQSENVGVQVYDGHQFSDVTIFEIQTTTPPVVFGYDVEVQSNHYLNMATGGTKNSIDGEVTGSMPVLEYFDPDGDPIEEFLFNDFSANDNGGHFVFKDIRVPSANYFRVKIEDLDELYYRGGEFGPQSESISVLANSNGVWGEASTFNIGTLKNQFKPELRLFDVNAKNGTIIDLPAMFTWSDGDGDAIESFSLYDDGDAAGSGFFSVNGVRQPAKVWFTLPWNQLSSVKYHLSQNASTENIRMTINDGRLDSDVESAVVNSITAPVYDANVNDVSLDTIERLPVKSLFSKLDPGPDFTEYQVYDENDFFRSGRLELDGSDLEQGVVTTLTADEFNRLVFKGAEVDFGRQLDPMLVRATNGITGWSEWERVNVNTDPVGSVSLTSGSQWTDSGPKTTITYMFIDGNADPFDPNNRPIPSYYVCPPLPNPDIECDTAGEDLPLNQPQREAIRETLDYYTTVANIEFIEVPYHKDGSEATMIFGAAQGPAGAAAWAYYPNGDVDNGKGSKAGDVWFSSAVYDPDTNFNVGLGSQFRTDAFHEIGHTFGLKHPFDGEPKLSIFMDFDYNTLMSYTHDSVHNPFDPYPEAPSSLMLYDIEELQRVYGANTDFNSGNNHYGNSLAGSYPYFVDNDEQHQTTLWDGGGIDTLNFTNHVANETIDLREGTWSSVNGVQQTTRIAYGTVIENARGGSGDDNIRGNEIRNLLFGNAGNDVLRGGGDNDVIRPGAGDDVIVWSLGDGRDSIREEGNGGIDRIEFYDPSGAVDSLEDDFIVRRFGSELRIDLTLDQGLGQGTVSVVDFDSPDSAVELMRLHGLMGTQVGNDIDLLSLFEIATSAPTRYQLTDVEGQNGGYIAAPVT